MKTFLLDSDIWIDFFRRRDEAVRLVEELSHEGMIMASVVTVTEIRAGWDDQQTLLYLPRFYAIAHTEPVTTAIAERAGAYRQNYAKRGVTLHTIDALIGSTAILKAYWLVTRNTQHYPMPELKLYPDLY